MALSTPKPGNIAKLNKTSHWESLANKIEMAINKSNYVFNHEYHMATICQHFAKEPEFAPYLDKEMKDYVLQRCIQWSLDYMQMPEELRTKEGEQIYFEKYPYLTKNKEEDLLSTAFSMGDEATMKMQEKPMPENLFFGGEIHLDKYTKLPYIEHGPRVQGCEMIGIGFIKNKEQYDTYIICGPNRNSLEWTYAIPYRFANKWNKRDVLLAIFMKQKIQNIFKKLPRIEPENVIVQYRFGEDEKITFTKGLDFDIPTIPDFKGLRFENSEINGLENLYAIYKQPQDKYQNNTAVCIKHLKADEVKTIEDTLYKKLNIKEHKNKTPQITK